MLQSMLRFGKRIAVLVPGLVIVYFSLRSVFPYFDSRLPVGLSILITYILAAYVLTPALIRTWRIIRPPDHLPLYCVTPDGFASDPLNIGIIGTRDQLLGAMQHAGWHIADQHSIANVIREIASIVFGRTYPNAPVSNLYLFGRKQDIAFEIPIGDNASSRHHVRFWATTYESKQALTFKSIHWQHRREHVLGDKLLWVGASSLDVGLAFIRHNLQISHMIHPDTNRERDLIVNHLKAVKLVKETKSIKLENPYKLMNRVWRGSLHTDGKMTIVTLKE